MSVLSIQRLCCNKMAKTELKKEPPRLTRRDQVEYLHSATLQNVVLALIATILAGYCALKSGYDVAASIWTALLVCSLGARLYGSYSFSRNTDKHSRISWENRYYKICALASVTGLIWAAHVLIFFDRMDQTNQTMMLLLLVCLATGSVKTLSVSRFISAIFSITYLLPVSWILIARQDQTSMFGYAGIVCMFSMIFWATQHQRRTSLDYATRRENRRLMKTAIRQHDKLRLLNEELKTARDSLLQLNQQLEQRVRQRTSLLQLEISEREGVQQELEAMASRDPLTGLSNRAKLDAVLREEIAQAKESGRFVALFFIDLDRFKEINDGLGHEIGDQVLLIIAKRLRSHAQSAGCVARWGGDEFIIVQNVSQVSSDRLEAYASDLGTHVRGPMQIDANTLRVGASVGIALYPIHGTDPESLIRHADLAVYQAKLDGRGRARMFQPIWQKEAKDRLDMVQSLKTAISENSLTMAYQPIVNPSTGQVNSMEALLRWTHPTLGEVAPDIFVRLAEENGLMVSLGNWVLRQAGRDAKSLISPYCPCVAINVSIQQFTNGDFIGVLDTVLAENRLSHDSIELEITETVYARNEDGVHKTLLAVRERGIRIAIDDFGTGYSSLAYLQRFPVDVLKVDRSFVVSLDKGGDTIIGAVTSMARSLGVEVVVEGIESVAELRRVRELGATSVQGFLFSRPMPLAEATEWLSKHQLRTLKTAIPSIGMMHPQVPISQG